MTRPRLSSPLFVLIPWLACLATACGGSSGGSSNNPGTDLQPPTTSANPPGGAYSAAQVVTLSSNEPATIYYTLDGSLPTVGGASTLSAASPVNGIAVGASSTINFFGVDTAGNAEVSHAQIYQINPNAPVVTILGAAPLAFGLLTSQTIQWSSSKSGTYQIELGGDGTPASGILLESGLVTALVPRTIEIRGSRLSFGPPQKLWIIVFDAASNVGTVSTDVALKALTSLAFPGTVSGLAISPNGSRAYLPRFDAHEVAVVDIDPASPTFHTVLGGISVGFQPGDIAITPDGSRGYVGHQGGVDVINLAAGTVSTLPLPGGASTADIAITPDGKRAYFARSAFVYALNTDPASPSYHVATPVALVDAAIRSGYVAITPDGKRLLLAWFGLVEYSVVVIDIDPASPGFHTVIGTPVPTVNSSAAKVSLSTYGVFGFIVNSLGQLARINLQTPPITINATNPASFPDAVITLPDSASILLLQRGANALRIARTVDLATTGGVLWSKLGDVGAITPGGHFAYLFKNAQTLTQELVRVPLD